MMEAPMPPLIAVLGDFSGNPTDPFRPLENRKFRSIDPDNFNDVIARMTPGLNMRVQNTLSKEGGDMPVQLKFESLEAFEPGNVAKQVEPLRKLLEQRDLLVDLAFYTNPSRARSASLTSFLMPPGRLEGLASRMEAWEAVTAQGADAPVDPELLLTELNTWQPTPTREFGPWLRERLLTLASWIHRSARIASDFGSTAIEAALAEIDTLLSRQLNPIFRHPAFRALESTWRGLHWLIQRAPSDGNWIIEVLNIGKQELPTSTNTVEAPRGHWEEETLTAYGLLSQKIGEFTCDLKGSGGQCVCLVGDYPFARHASDLWLLTVLAELASSLEAPFVAGASPEFLDLKSWNEFDPRTDLRDRFQGPDYGAWHALLRDSCASHLILSLPDIQVRTNFRKKENVASKSLFQKGGISYDRV
jgi:type VI secretion system protein ImpC